ncbi:uncharacterized protein LOC120069734 [Benincasa hispida]|uniref:uncharacterized protein LOC120069734 n=1 Tax=Benincasa hispida TaxID=102211 RepID=UPI0019028F3F|nr:uncharacterized protein LOC120069734 [Benincasa hispida]
MLQPQLPRFEGKNYRRWRQQMKVLYGSQDLWDIVDRGYSEPKNEDDAETIEDFFNRVLLIVNQLRSNGETIEDQRVVEKILRIMTRRYEHIVVAIEESKDLSTLSINSLMGSLQSHELRLKLFDSNPLEKAFHMQSSSRGRSGGRRVGRGNRGNGRSNVVTSQRAETINLLQIEEGEEVQIEQEAEVVVVEIFLTYNVSIVDVMDIFKQTDNDQGLLFLTFNVQETSTEKIWYLDSGCSNHLTGRKDIFISLDESHENVVKTGDNKKLEVKGK